MSEVEEQAAGAEAGVVGADPLSLSLLDAVGADSRGNGRDVLLMDESEGGTGDVKAVMITEEDTANTDKQKSANMDRRIGIDHHTDVHLALLKRVKKISIEIPFVTQEATRLQKIIIGVNDYIHIVHETKGGKYGVPSRPDLETQLIAFPEQTRSGEPGSLSIPMLFSTSRHAFVMSAKQEDELLTALTRHAPDSVGLVKEAIVKAGDHKLNVLSSAKQRTWRKFVYIHMRPLASDPDRVAEAVTRLRLFEGLHDNDAAAMLDMEHREYGADGDSRRSKGNNSSGEEDEEDEESGHKKSKKKQQHSGKKQKKSKAKG